MNTSRREFLKQAGALAAAGMFLPELVSAAPLTKVGVQLYSVKELIDKNVPETLKQLAAIGYKEVESYPNSKGHYFGYKPQEFSKMLSDLGMKLVSSHVSSGAQNAAQTPAGQATLSSNLDGVIELASQTGQSYLTCSWLDESYRKTADDAKRVGDLFNIVGEACKKANLQFAYHNHDFEFKKVGEVVPYDSWLKTTDPELVKFELDLYWVVEGGLDPITYFNQYPNRFPLCHVKDKHKTKTHTTTEIGMGNIDYSKILKVAKAKGMKHFIVEQEHFERPAMDSMKTGYSNLTKISV